MRLDCSTGADKIPAKYLKLSAEYIASPLTHIINCYISSHSFPKAWKNARVSPIPKVDSTVEADDYRPIAILPCLSKVYERLMLSQLVSYIERLQVYSDKIAGYRKGHCTTTVLMQTRDDIINAMKKGEVTLITFADFSKVFDTVNYSVIIRKLHNIGFSKQALRWSLSYLTDRQQFVQVNDTQSQFMDVQFGIPQGSILGPVLFNLYVNDMRNSIQDGFNFHQYANDMTIYQHCKPKCLQTCILNMNENMNNLETWAGNCNLLLNEKKTKQTVIATCQMSRAHNLGLSTYTPSIKLKNKCIERVDNFNLLGTWLNENLTWANHINNIVPSCYKTLATLRRIKNMTRQETKKSLAQSLVLSKLHFNDTVTYPLPAFLQKKVQRVQNKAASFVLNRFCLESAHSIT